MKIGMGIALWGVLCCAPPFIHADENAPAATIPVPPSPVTDQPSRISPTVDDAGSFTVSYPAPVTHEAKELDTPMGKVKGIMGSCTTDTGFYGVCYGDFPIDKSIANLAEFYQKTLTATVEGQHLQLLSQSTFKVGEVEGLDYIANFSTTNAVTHVRMFLVRHRSYQVIYVGATGTENSKNALAFLDSFRLVDATKSVAVINQPARLPPPAWATAEAAVLRSRSSCAVGQAEAGEAV